jgi:Zn-dependent protease
MNVTTGWTAVGDDFIRNAILAGPAILFALTVHEYFHAWTALRFGDPTARDLGRLTLNPLKHLDLFGTIMMFASQFRFGWAKPVPVNPANLRNVRTADIWISAAGPLSNLGLGLIFGLIFRLILAMNMAVPDVVVFFLVVSVQINVSLAFFNLIPIFPLDGSHILRNLLPAKHGPLLDRLERVGPIILIALILTGGAWLVIGPFIVLFVTIFTGL